MEPLFFKNRPIIVASLPCYESENVDSQRGEGVFDKSIKALQWLNSMGYGEDYELILAYNPVDAVLPRPASILEPIYRDALRDKYGIFFTRLIAITNAPVGRYKDLLIRTNKYDAYLDLLKDNMNPSTFLDLMCRGQVNVDWEGNVFDCDFNNQISLMPFAENVKLWDLDFVKFSKQAKAVGEHCFSCTAGSGSSCKGELS